VCLIRSTHGGNEKVVLNFDLETSCERKFSTSRREYEYHIVVSFTEVQYNKHVNWTEIATKGV